MKDIRLLIEWYGLFMGIPLILLNLAVTEWIIGSARQRVMSQCNRPQR
ncbi:MAG: hypothetical protein R3B37_04140 [Nitrospira sp.]|nr:hypothetical protein [Nitrospira sp.]